MKHIYFLILLWLGVICSYGQSNIEEYEYWFNNDFANKTTTTVTTTQQLLVNQNIPTTGLTNGIHVFNIRFKDNEGLWSSTTSEFFYKMPSTAQSTSNLVSYEYWLDNDYASAVVVNTPVQKQINVNELISMSTLTNGIHVFNIRFKDDRGLWSSTTSNFFYKMPEQTIGNNLITEYRYWVGNDFVNAVNVVLQTPIKQFNLIDNLDFTKIPKGEHSISFQFKDNLGMWSSVTTDTITKKSLPIADFSYSTQVGCGSTVVSFTDLSIDGDEYLWNFDDGNTSTLANPTHVYNTSNTYQVNLKVTDTLLGTHDTHTINLPININNVDVSVTQNGELLTANTTGAAYQWLDCNNGFSVIDGETNQSFTATQNGSYAVKITQNNCVETSTCYAVTTLNVFENTFSNKIIVYPNPTYGMVKIDLGKVMKACTVRINDINGKLINLSSYKNTQTLELDLNLEPGMYFISIDSENKKTTMKLIKH